MCRSPTFRGGPYRDWTSVLAENSDNDLILTLQPILGISTLVKGGGKESRADWGEEFENNCRSLLIELH